MSKKINCREVALRLQTYLDGELDESRMSQIEQHLNDCVACGLEEEVFAAVKADLLALQRPADSDALERLREFSSRVAEVATSET